VVDTTNGKKCKPTGAVEGPAVSLHKKRPHTSGNKFKTVPLQQRVADADEDKDKDEEDDSVDDDAWAVDWNQLELLDEDKAVDDVVELKPGDTLGKALALVNQVCCKIYIISLMSNAIADMSFTSGQGIFCVML